MNTLVFARGLFDQHKIREKFHEQSRTCNRFIWSSKNKSKSLMNTLVFETGISDHHKIRVKSSWTH